MFRAPLLDKDPVFANAKPHASNLLMASRSKKRERGASKVEATKSAFSRNKFVSRITTSVQPTASHDNIIAEIFRLKIKWT